MAYFTIHPGNDHITLDSKTRSGAMVLSVQNKTGVARRVRAFVTAADPAQTDWYTVKEPIQPARVDETLQFPVDVSAAPDAEAGSYGFRLEVVAEDDPDDVHEESQQLTVEVPAAPRPFPLWIVAVVVVLAVVGVLAWLLLRNGGGAVAVPDLTGQTLEDAEQSLDEAGPEERIAHYPLTDDGRDAIGVQNSMTLANTTFSNGGIFCNGVHRQRDDGCDIITPNLAGFDFNSFSISVEFQVADAADRPVIVGGSRFRWIGFLLNADRTVTLLHSPNTQRHNCGGTYDLATWQQAMLTYDGIQGQLYLNGQLLCEVPYTLRHDNDANVGVTNRSNATTFRGWIRNLEVHREVLVP